MKNTNLNHREIADICQELALLLHSGVQTANGLTLLAEGETVPEAKAMLSQMAEQMDNGKSLADAMKNAGSFPAYACDLVHIGEETGRLEEALNSLAAYYERRMRLDQHLRSALLYPAILLLVMLAVIIILLAKVLPVFNSVYNSLGGQLSGFAGGLLSIGMVLDKLMPVLCVLLILAVIFLVCFSALPDFRSKLINRWQKNRANKGGAGKLNTARFAQALAMGIGSGLPVEDALDLAAGLLSDLPAFEQNCKDCKTDIANGTALATALQKTGLMPPAESRLLELAVFSGTQDTVIQQIAERLNEESETALESAIGKIEPTLVIVASVLVGMILLSVMLPLMHIMTAIG